MPMRARIHTHAHTILTVFVLVYFTTPQQQQQQQQQNKETVGGQCNGILSSSDSVYHPKSVSGVC